jgi:hypothetical protein
MMRDGARAGVAIVVAGVVAACAVVAPPVSKLPDGSYRLACKDTLASCLGTFETICRWHGYDVISASERRHRTGGQDVPDETIASEVEVRCKSGDALFGGSPAPPPPPTEPASPPAAEPPPAPALPGPCAESSADGGAPSVCGVEESTPNQPPATLP